MIGVASCRAHIELGRQGHTAPHCAHSSSVTHSLVHSAPTGPQLAPSGHTPEQQGGRKWRRKWGREKVDFEREDKAEWESEIGFESERAKERD